MTQERRKVMVCGDLHNLGDLKLLLQNLKVDGPALVRRWRDLPPQIERQVQAAGGTLIDARDLPGFARACWGATLVIGGGQLVRNNQSPRSLAGLLVAAVAARAGGGRVVTRGLGVSRVASQPSRFFWSRILRRADRVRVRDGASADHAAALVGAGRVTQTADMVFLAFDPARAVPGPEGQRDTVVVAPCDDPGEGRTVPPALTDALIRAAQAAIADARLVLACHDPQPAMDLAPAQAIAARHAALAPTILADYDMAVLESVYPRAGLVITNRLHSVIFSLLNGAPVLIVDDGNPKLRAVAAMFGLPLIADAAADAIPGIVERALSVDHAHRRTVLAELHARARGNIAEAGEG